MAPRAKFIHIHRTRSLLPSRSAYLPLPSSSPGLFSASTLASLEHSADAVLKLESISDDSEVFALLPDAARCVYVCMCLCMYVCVC